MPNHVVRYETEHVTACNIIKKLVKRRFKPQLNNLDRENRKALKAFMNGADEIFQLTPPHIYQVNASEMRNPHVEESFHVIHVLHQLRFHTPLMVTPHATSLHEI